MLLTRGLRREREDGAAVVEFALVFCFVLVPLVMGMLDFGWYFYSSQVASSSTRETARRLSVGDCQTQPVAEGFVRKHSGFRYMTLEYGSTSSYDNNLPAVGQTLQVRSVVSAKLIGIMPLPDAGNITRVVQVRVEDTTQDSPC